MNEQDTRISELAGEVLRLSRNTLLVNLRFLDAALSRLEPMELPELIYATDGRYLAYDPRHVCPLRRLRSHGRVHAGVVNKKSREKETYEADPFIRPAFGEAGQ